MKRISSGNIKPRAKIGGGGGIAWGELPVKEADRMYPVHVYYYYGEGERVMTGGGEELPRTR